MEIVQWRWLILCRTINLDLLKGRHRKLKRYVYLHQLIFQYLRLPEYILHFVYLVYPFSLSFFFNYPVICLSNWLGILLHTCLPTYLPIYLSVYTSICLPTLQPVLILLPYRHPVNILTVGIIPKRTKVNSLRCKHCAEICRYIFPFFIISNIVGSVDPIAVTASVDDISDDEQLKPR